MKLLLITALSITILSAFQQAPDDYALVVKKQAEEMGKALVVRDYPTYIKYTDPRIVQEMGGPAAFTDSLKGYQSSWNRYNMKLTSILAGKPSEVIDTAGEMQCTVPVSTEMKVQGGTITNITTFIAISKDQGKNWVFIDTEADYKSIRQKYNDLNSKLEVPPPAQPVFRAEGH